MGRARVTAASLVSSRLDAGARRSQKGNALRPARVGAMRRAGVAADDDAARIKRSRKSAMRALHENNSLMIDQTRRRARRHAFRALSFSFSAVPGAADSGLYTTSMHARFTISCRFCAPVGPKTATSAADSAWLNRAEPAARKRRGGKVPRSAALRATTVLSSRFSEFFSDAPAKWREDARWARDALCE